jgi:zinc transport system substrate-binding protein
MMLCPPALLAADPKVTVSIMPIHSLTSRIMQGIAKPELLIQGSQSPHTFQLSPSQRRLLEHSDLLIWVGPDMETFLQRITRSLPADSQQLILMDAKGVHDKLRETKSGHHHDHHHEGHHSADPHIWLSPQIAMSISRAIADKLSELDPVHSTQYQDNASQLIQDLRTLDHTLKTRLSPLAGIPFVVYHDAYGYLVASYGLNQAGLVTLDEHRAPGAGHLRALRQQLKEDEVRCLFTEPQFEPRVVNNLIEDTGIRTGELDPLGAGLEPGPEAYFILMQALANSFEKCLN